MSNIPLVCSNCGSDKFTTTSKPKSLDDLEGASCANCGTPFNRRGVENQAKRVAEDLVRDALRKAGFK